jgi:twitching motility protein PilI
MSATPKNQRRRSLRAYQRELVERTRAARAEPDQQSKRLAVQAGQEKFLFDLTQTGEVMNLTGLSAVPLTKPWFLGLTQCRGNLVGVIDLAGFLGQPVAAPDKSDRLLIFASSLSVHCALRVSRVLGLINVSTMQRQPVPPDAPDWASLHYRDSQASRWTELDLAALVQAPAFLDISLNN